MEEYSEEKSDNGKLTVERVLADLKRSQRYLAPLHKAIEKDFEYLQGKQWEDGDVASLKAAGVKALTINKLKPIMRLLTGIERQSKSDFVAFPEGQEDGLVADITTALLKNLVKKSSAERKLSEQFKRGGACGVDFIEPYIDYTNNLINGQMRLKNLNPLNCFFDPDCEEYDLSDGKFFIVLVTNLSKSNLKRMFPKKKKEIDSIGNGKINVDGIGGTDKHVQGLDYPALSEARGGVDNISDCGYDLIKYHYKSSVSKYFIIDPIASTVQPVDDKKVAEDYISQFPDATLIEKSVDEIRTACICGDVILEDEVAWTYPRWKNFPIFSYFAEWLGVDVGDSALNIQGIIRGLIDLQDEYNKRRTQELRHLNSSVNSGIMYPKGSLSEQEKEKIKKYGSSPGISIEYDAQVGKPEKIYPTPLSQGHAQLATENAQDLKEASGVNPDLLANSDNDQSGRAILLKQKQGLVMIQELLDNYSDTKKTLGKFLLSQLGEIYTVETAVKVLGSSFLKKNQEFNKPKVSEDGQPVVDGNGQLDLEIDEEMVKQVINQVLNDAEIGDYDVSIGEGAYSETVRMANYMMLVDMIQKGIPIPPDVLISESTLPEGSKQKILSSIENAQMAAIAAKQNNPNLGNGEKDARASQGNSR